MLLIFLLINLLFYAPYILPSLKAIVLFCADMVYPFAKEPVNFQDLALKRPALRVPVPSETCRLNREVYVLISQMRERCIQARKGNDL